MDTANKKMIRCSRCFFGIKWVSTNEELVKYQCDKCFDVDYDICPSCKMTAAICKFQGFLKLEERPSQMLYQCQQCKIKKCSNCIGELQCWVDVRNRVPENGCLEFHSMKGVRLHSCSQLCHNSYEELN